MAVSGRIPRVVWIAGLVLGVPLAACAGLAWIGKQVADEQTVVGHLATAAEIRAARNRPPPTPAQLLTGARDRMADGYDPATRLGGCLDGATGYLSRVPPAAPEATEAAVLDREIEARMTRAGQREAGLARAAQAQGAPSQGAPSQGAPSQGAPSQGAPSQGAPSQGATAHPAGAPSPEPTVDPAIRTALAQRMTRDFVGAGFHVGRFTAEGDHGTELLFSHTRCGRGFLQGLTAAPADRAALQALGFVRVRCEPHPDTADLADALATGQPAVP